METLGVQLGALRSAAQPLNDRAIVGEGTPEGEWQAWRGLHALPAISFAAFLAKGRRIVVVSPHPDDEILGCGGLLAMLAQNQRECLVVAVTNGEASHAGSNEWEPAALGHHRQQESVEGLLHLGFAVPQRFDMNLPDGAVSEVKTKLIDLLLPILTPTDTVVSTWRWDGHPDHDATGAVVAQVCKQVECTHVEVPIWMWHWARPGDVRVPWKQMRRLELAPGIMRRKTQAIGAHRTQLTPQDSGKPAVLPPWALARMLRPFEYLLFPDCSL